MKGFKRLLIVLSIGFILASQGAFAGEGTECPYGGQIDKLISFYQGRIYLIDSKYEKLAEIGKEAQERVAFLQNQRAELITELQQKEVNPNPRKITGYIALHTQFSEITVEAYEEP